MPGGVSSPVRAFRGVGGEPVFIRGAQGAWLEGGRRAPLRRLHRRLRADDPRPRPSRRGGGDPRRRGARAELRRAHRRRGRARRAHHRRSAFGRDGAPGLDRHRGHHVGAATGARGDRPRPRRQVRGLLPRRRRRLPGRRRLGRRDSRRAVVTGRAGGGDRRTRCSRRTTISTASKRSSATAGATIAAVIVEPIAGNMGVVPPASGFLAGLRELCTRHGALLVFDEVMTGFRVAWGGAQSLFGIEPDLTCLAKVIGGGLPVAAYAGRRELMRRIAPAGDVYQAGTLSGNPIAVAAGAATLDVLADGDGQALSRSRGGRRSPGARYRAAARRATGSPAWCTGRGRCSPFFLTAGPVQLAARRRRLGSRRLGAALPLAARAWRPPAALALRDAVRVDRARRRRDRRHPARVRRSAGGAGRRL